MFQSRKINVLLGLVLLSVVSSLFFASYGGVSNGSFSSREFSEAVVKKLKMFVSNPKVEPNISSYKKILLWNDYFGHKDFHVGFGYEPMLRLGCPVNTCYITNNRTLFPQGDLDAVIWHLRGKDRKFPSIRYRSPHTRYVFYCLESPSSRHVNLTRFKGVFNYTMTYRRDSDIYSPYGEFWPLAENDPQVNTNINFAAGKTKMAAWFASNCASKSERGLMIKNLRKYFPIDVYGRCGNMTCPRNQYFECMHMLETNYKFYMAFENALCMDYVTEKFYNISSFNIIPVVYGMADYKQLAPPHSFINVRDYKTVKHLADYLLYLAGNDTAYNEYFQWRNKYKIIPDHTQAWCRLCEKLHTDHEKKTYYNMSSWFITDICVTPATVLGDGYLLLD